MQGTAGAPLLGRTRKGTSPALPKRNLISAVPPSWAVSQRKSPLRKTQRSSRPQAAAGSRNAGRIRAKSLERLMTGLLFLVCASLRENVARRQPPRGGKVPPSRVAALGRDMFSKVDGRVLQRGQSATCIFADKRLTARIHGPGGRMAPLRPPGTRFAIVCGYQAVFQPGKGRRTIELRHAERSSWSLFSDVPYEPRTGRARLRGIERRP